MVTVLDNLVLEEMLISLVQFFKIALNIFFVGQALCSFMGQAVCSWIYLDKYVTCFNGLYDQSVF